MFTSKPMPKNPAKPRRKGSPYATGKRHASPAMLARIVSLLPAARAKEQQTNATHDE